MSENGFGLPLSGISYYSPLLEGRMESISFDSSALYQVPAPNTYPTSQPSPPPTSFRNFSPTKTASSENATAYNSSCHIPTNFDTPVHSPAVALRFGALKRFWRIKLITPEVFKGEWNQAYKEGLVPFNYDETGLCYFDKITTSFPKVHSPDLVQCCFHQKLQALLYEATNTLSRPRPLKDTQFDCAKLLRFMAHIEAESEQQLWRSELQDLSGDANVPGFFNPNFSFHQMQWELEQIHQAQLKTQAAESAPGIHPFTGEGRRLQGVASPLEFDKDFRGFEFQAQLLSKLQQYACLPAARATSHALFREAAKAPDMHSHSAAVFYIDSSLIHTMYKPAHNGTYLNELELFTEEFNKRGSFSEQVIEVFNAKTANKELSFLLFSLHFGCKVLVRDIPHKEEFKQFEGNGSQRLTPDEINTLERIDSHENYLVLKHVQVYLPVLISALEDKARELNVALYMEPLPKR